MKLRKSTWVYLALFVVAIVLVAIDGPSDRLGGLGTLAVLAAWTAGPLLLWRVARASWSVVVHRLALRLAFSYFLIGIVPIPLLAALFACLGFLLSHQYIATRLRSEVDNLAEIARAEGADVPRVTLDRNGRVTSSEVDWLSVGDEAAWARELEAPHPVVGDGRVWIGIRTEGAKGSVVRLLPIGDRSAPYLQRLADRTEWDVAVEVGAEEKSPTGYQIRVNRNRDPKPDLAARFVSPRHPPAVPKNVWGKSILAGVYVDRAVAVVGKKGSERPRRGVPRPHLSRAPPFAAVGPGGSRIEAGRAHRAPRPRGGPALRLPRRARDRLRPRRLDRAQRQPPDAGGAGDRATAISPCA